jgi:hypothetical protein
MAVDAKGKVPESWNCVDCGINTAPGLLNREETERAFSTAIALEKLGGPKASVEQHVGGLSEVYIVHKKVWAASGVEEMGGCLCIGCLEKRIGRQLTPKDFMRDHPFNTQYPGTERLKQRQGRA